jgi:hypothetical protein
MVFEAPVKPAIVERSVVAATRVLNSLVDLALIVITIVISVDSNARPELKYVLSICTSPTGISNIAAIWYLNCDIAAAMSSGLESVVTAVNVPLIRTARVITAVHTSAMFTYPDEHVQLLTDELALGELEPTGHETHVAVPVTFLYWPAAHAEHRPPFGPVYPALQLQFVCDPLPGPASELTGHKLQFGLPSGDHCPSGHARHVSLPVAP